MLLLLIDSLGYLATLDGTSIFPITGPRKGIDKEHTYTFCTLSTQVQITKHIFLDITQGPAGSKELREAC